MNNTLLQDSGFNVSMVSKSPNFYNRYFLLQVGDRWIPTGLYTGQKRFVILMSQWQVNHLTSSIDILSF